MIEYSTERLQELIQISQESLSNGKILTILDELEKSFPQIVKKYSINTIHNHESIEELVYNKNIIKEIIFYSKMELYKKNIDSIITKEKEEIYLQNAYEGLQAYNKIQENIIAMINHVKSLTELEHRCKEIKKIFRLNSEKLEYFYETIKIFDNEKIIKTLKTVEYNEYTQAKNTFLRQTEYMTNTIKETTETLKQEKEILNKKDVTRRYVTIPILDSKITFEYSLN